FSSRRRHTRFSRDWSSDVCSSDLSGTMRNQVAHIAALFGRRLTLWFAVAWNLMFALWIAAGGLEVKTAYVAHDARMANLPMILTWAAVNFCILIGWYTVATR